MRLAPSQRRLMLSREIEMDRRSLTADLNLVRSGRCQAYKYSLDGGEAFVRCK